MGKTSSEATPTSVLVARYLRWLRNEWGATPTTMRDYTGVLRRMTEALGSRELVEVTTDDLRDAIDLWANKTPRTRAKVTSVVRALWAWAEDEGLIERSPADRLKRPRTPRRVAPMMPSDAHPRLIAAADRPNDRLALTLLNDLGLRKSELAGVQQRDFDLGRRTLTVFGKGQKERVLPLRGPVLDELDAYLGTPLELLERAPEPDDFLLYPEKRSQGKRLIWADPKKRQSEPAMHRWWYGGLAAAGMVEAGVTSGLNMHRARHGFATRMRRAAGIDAASQALGHSELNTTLSIYGHRDQGDLELAMDAYAKANGC